MLGRLMKTHVNGLFIFICLFTILSCQSKWFTYVGHEVAEEDRLVIDEGGENEGSWRTYDLKLDYVYERDRDVFRLSGEVIWAQHLIYNFRTLEHFNLRVYFIDAVGRILEGRSVIFAGHKADIEHISFDEQYTLPPGTVAMVFGYSGRTTEHGSGSDGEVPSSQIDWDFWKNPVRGSLFLNPLGGRYWEIL